MVRLSRFDQTAVRHEGAMTAAARAMVAQVKAGVNTPATFPPDGNLGAIPMARERCNANDAGGNPQG